jgi:hypothetical protein
MLVFLPLFTSSATFSLFRTLDSANSPYFGSSTALCPAHQLIVVAAAPNFSTATDRGALYFSDYERSGHTWSGFHEILPEDHDGIEIDNSFYHASVSGLGASIGISSDCSTIIASAPYTSYTNENVTHHNVGAVLIYKIADGKVTSQVLVPPSSISEGGLFGTRLEPSSDIHSFAATCDDDWHVFAESPTGWEETFHGKTKPGVDTMEFVDASTLVVGTDIYKRSNGTWKPSQSFPPIPDFTAKHAAMPETDQTIVAFANDRSIAFLGRDDATNKWEHDYTIEYPAGGVGGKIDFCTTRYLASVGTFLDGPVVFLFERDGLRFKYTGVIASGRVTSFAWDDDRCSRFLVGAPSFGAGKSEVFVYQWSNMGRLGRIEAQLGTVVIPLVVLGSALFAGVLIASVLYWAFKLKRNIAARRAVGRADAIVTA